MVSDSDKIIVTRYPPLPCVCCICNRSSNGEREYVDFQMSLDIYGAVVICTECMAPVAQALGFVPESKIDVIAQDHSVMVDELERLITENGRLNSTLDSLLGLRPTLGRNNSVSDEESVEDSGQDDQQPALPIEFSGEDNSGPSESATERRPKNVSQPSLNL